MLGQPLAAQVFSPAWHAPGGQKLRVQPLADARFVYEGGIPLFFTFVFYRNACKVTGGDWTMDDYLGCNAHEPKREH